MPTSKQRPALSKQPPSQTAEESLATELPLLFKLSKTGELQFWLIRTEGNKIISEWGQVGTDSPQTTSETIKEGKNLGKKNETSPAQQAAREAKSKWTNKIARNGYTEDKKKASRGERETEAPLPMLAHNFHEEGHKMPFPCIGQPKFDGIRSMAVRLITPETTLWTRKGVILTGLPHINRSVSELHGLGSGILDGEIYNHAFKAKFEHIQHLAKQPKPLPDSTDAHLYVYDVFSDEPYRRRKEMINDLIGDDHPYLIKVPSFWINSPEECKAQHDRLVKLGFEGLMLRDPDAPYEHARSYGLQKYKEFMDTEFPIVAVREGRGKLAGHGIFICEAPNGKRFEAKLVGEQSALIEIWEHPERFIGKQLTVKHFGWTKNGLPRFAQGLRVRDWE